MTEEELKNEMYQDMLQEAREDERIENLLVADYEFFCNYYFIDDLYEEIEKIKDEIVRLHNKHGWELEDA